jgi:hypothetical protein
MERDGEGSAKKMQAPKAMDTQMEASPESFVEHPFGTIKAWMSHTHFLMKRLGNVKMEISLHILAYNLKRVMQILGTGPLIAAIQT